MALRTTAKTSLILISVVAFIAAGQLYHAFNVIRPEEVDRATCDAVLKALKRYSETHAGRDPTSLADIEDEYRQTSGKMTFAEKDFGKVRKGVSFVRSASQPDMWIACDMSDGKRGSVAVGFRSGSQVTMKASAVAELNTNRAEQ